MDEQVVSHYRILSRLGQGGMGEVYLAEDTRLGRKVALKFLAPDLAREREALLRFRNEARAVADLSHPCIATLHDLGESQGRPYLVFEYVEGRTLRQRIREGPSSVHEVLHTGAAIAAGLVAAHAKGIIHRDIKSTNVMITSDGAVKILDFGLARRDDATQLTRPGVTPGTVFYMSPEQAAGRPTDRRCDLWSLGVVLYECLTGRLPFEGESASSVLYRVQHEVVEPPTARRSGIPLDVESAVLRCLEKDPSLRFQSAADLEAELRRLDRNLDSGRVRVSASDGVRPVARPRRLWAWVGAGAALLAVVASVALWPRPSHVATTGFTVLVHPFEVLGAADPSEYVGLAIAEAIAVRLAQLPDLHVLPVPAVGSTDRSLPGRRSRGSASLLELTGTIGQVLHGLSVSTRVVDAEEQRLLWGIQESFDPQELPRVANVVVDGLVGRLGISAPFRYEYFRYVGPSPAMVDWPELAETVAALRAHDVDRGLPLTERLVRRFPDEYAAHVMRLVALVDNQFVNATPEAMELLQDGIARVRAVDPRAPIAAIATSWNLDSVEEQLAILSEVIARGDLMPGSKAHALRTRGRVLGLNGRHEEAMRDLDEAMRLDPANYFNYGYAATVLASAGRVEEAEQRLRQQLALSPDWGAYDLSFFCATRGRDAEALEYLEQALEAGLAGRAWVDHPAFKSLRHTDGFERLVRRYATHED